MAYRPSDSEQCRFYVFPCKDVATLFTEDYERLKFALVGAFQPSFVQGEINMANKNKGKINNCGFNPMKAAR